MQKYRCCTPRRLRLGGSCPVEDISILSSETLLPLLVIPTEPKVCSSQRQWKSLEVFAPLHSQSVGWQILRAFWPGGGAVPALIEGLTYLPPYL